ncbi:hypothetical protein Tco_1332251 [Tanacetum coccineum]
MLLIQLQSVQERLRLFNNPITVIDVPESESSKTATSPEQTASGKDSTNPLKADALLNKHKYKIILTALLEQAQMELRLYGEAKKATTLLRPKINPLINKRREAARDQRFLKEEPIGLEPMVYFQEFVQLWNKARSACQQDFINERFYTTDKPTKSLYNFIEGSDPQLIYQAFRAGLIDNIYPSNNLLEIKEFHSSIFEAIKRFRKNVLKAQDKKIYIKVTSSIPDWNHEENYSPYHCMEIGLAKSNENLHFSKAMEDKSQNPFLEVIKSQRVQGLKRISEIILQAITEENRKVNYADSHCIVISYKNEVERQDIQLLTQYGIPFLTNTIDAASTTKEAFCKHARQLFEEHSCIYCKDKNEEKEAGPSTSPKEPTTDEESS